MKRKIIALCAAVLLLAGCSTEDTWLDRKFPGLNDRLFGGGSSTASYTAPPEVIGSSSAGSSSQPQQSEPEDDYARRHITVPLINDTLNKCSLTIDGELLTLEMREGDWFAEEITIGNKRFDTDKNGSTLTFTYDGTGTRTGYVSIHLTCGRYVYHYRVKHDQNGYSFPDVMTGAQRNLNAAENYTTLTYEQTLRYITKDGKAANADAVMRKIKQLSNQICRGQKSDYDKLRAISRWVSHNIYYDHVAYRKGIPNECVTLEYMLERGTSVCGGYAAMTAALCEAQGITCLHIDGSAINQENCYAEINNGAHHEWNYAIINGRGIWVDSGWNSHSDFYAAGDFKQNEIGCKYFDIGNEAMALDHRVVQATRRTYFE